MTKNVVLYFLLIILFESNLFSADDFRWINNLPKPWMMKDQKHISNVLTKFQKKIPNFHQRLKAINYWRVGTPYGLYKLGEERGVDKDPLLRIDSSDCTTHVLTSIALANSKSWDMARDQIVKIHYKNSETMNSYPDYKNRWHFTSDRILNNIYTNNITDSFSSSFNLSSLEITLNKKSDGNKFLDINWESEQVINFIPKEYINRLLLNKLPDICGIAFIKLAYKKIGLLIAHEGVLIDKKDFIHASSEQNETVKVDFIKYFWIKGAARFDGIMIFDFIEYE